MLITNRYNEFQEMDDKVKKKFDKSKFDNEVKNLILFAFIWSFGSLLNSEDRNAYNKFLGEIIKGKTNINDDYKL